MVGVEQGGCLSNKLIADRIQRIAWQVLEVGDRGGQNQAPHPDQIPDQNIKPMQFRNQVRGMWAQSRHQWQVWAVAPFAFLHTLPVSLHSSAL